MDEPDGTYQGIPEATSRLPVEETPIRLNGRCAHTMGSDKRSSSVAGAAVTHVVKGLDWPPLCRVVATGNVTE